MTRFKWYRRKHLREFIPDNLKEVYDNINSGIPNDLERTLQVLDIVRYVQSDNYKI
jgi:hypothetical protein